MASQSFHSEDADQEAKNLSILTANQNLNQIPYKSSPKKQEKEFLQLYIKARTRDSEIRTKKKPKLEHVSFSARSLKKRQHENQGDEIPSPKTAGNVVARKAILKNLDVNNLSQTITANKPSKFKLNHESNVKDQIEDIKISSFDLRDKNNESLHDIEFKNDNNVSQCPASMDILLPAPKESHSHRSNDLEANNIQRQENVIELEQQQQQEPANRQDVQEHDNQNQVRNPDHGRTSIITNNQPSRIAFSRNVEKTYENVFKIYLIWFSSYGVLLGFDFGIFPYFVVFMFALLFESYIIYEICKEDPRQQYDPLHEKKKLNYTFQVLSIILLEILGLLKYIKIDLPLSIASIPIFLTTIFSCYLYNSGDRRNSNGLTTVFQALLSLQILTLCLKVDDVLQWSWQGVFWVSWAFLAASLLYCIGLSMMFLFYVCFEESNITRSSQFGGLIWILTALSGCIGVLFFLLSGFTDRLEYGTDNDKISKALIGGMSHILFLAAYTWLFKTKIKKFLRRIVRPDIQIELPEIEPKVRFEKATEGLPSYIVRFTPSYFLTFDDSLKMKDMFKLKNIKKKISLMKLYQYRRFVSGRLWKGKETSDLDKPDKMPLVKNHLNLDVDQLNGKQAISHVKRIRPHVLETSSPAYLKPKYYGSEMKNKLDKSEEILSPEEGRNEKLCFSANDIEFMKKIDTTDFLSEVRTPLQINKKVASEKEDEKTCIICCDKFPDAVIMGCGHGGICYECALESWKKSQECFMCRAKIDKVLHIDTNKLGQFNMRKVLSATKLARDQPRSEYYRPREDFVDAMYIARNHI